MSRKPEFWSESPEATGRTPPVALVQLITTGALALSTLVAVTAVSIGIARADVPGALANADGAAFAIAVLLGSLLSGMGGLAAVIAEDRKRSG
jgi:hypothetical protein